MLIWEKNLILDISSVGNKLYMVKIMGKGLVNNQSIDCSEPLVYSMSLDSNGRQTDQKILSNGSCPESRPTFIESKDENNGERWIVTQKGLTKTKKWSVNEKGERWTCVVGPCDWIKNISRTFYYERVN